MATSYSVRHLGEVSTTQDLARAGFDSEPVLVTATAQTTGRGRSGSVWQNAPRALAASLAFRLDRSNGDGPPITLIAGVAAAGLIEGSSLKWPNDVLIGDAKVAGILAEVSEGLVVAGLGVNMWWPEAPAGVAAVHDDDPGVSAGRRLAEAWAESLLGHVDAGPERWPIDTYRRLSASIGREIAWEPDGVGRAVDIDLSGALIVETPAGPHRLTSGAVTHVRATDDK